MPSPPWSESPPPTPVKSGWRAVRLVVAVGVLEHEQVGAVADEDATALVLAVRCVVLLDGQSHGYGEDPVGEDGHLVGLAVTVGIFEDLDPVGLVDLAERAVSPLCSGGS